MNEKHSRRTFCRRSAAFALAGGVAGALGEGCSLPTSPGNVPSLPIVNGASAGGGVSVGVDASSPLDAVGSAALVQSASGDFLVAHTSQSTFVALSAICTHQTCTITGFGNGQFVCPCHGSTFNTSGQVLGGPAPRDLFQFPTQFVNGVLTITV